MRERSLIRWDDDACDFAQPISAVRRLAIREQVLLTPLVGVSPGT